MQDQHFILFLNSDQTLPQVDNTGSSHGPGMSGWWCHDEGILLDARKLGAGQVTREAAGDPTVKAYVAQHGNPDFVLVASPRDLELVYVTRSVLAYFRRPTAGAPSVVSEVPPLPSGLYLMLPADLRAGTSAPINPVGPNCWTVPIADESCRTCCLGAGACTVQCTPATTR